MNERGSRRRAIVFAYACEPARGSEPGAGWGVVRALAQCAECTVLVGPEHEGALRKWEREAGGHDGLEFVIVPEATGGGATMRARRGRLGWFFAYLGWIGNAARVAARLERQRAFDVACHVSYSTYWLPSPAAGLGIPLVWGPVGGAVTTPPRLWPALGLRGWVEEMIDLLAVRLAAMSPPVRRTWRAVTAAVVQNEATRARLPESLRQEACLVNHAVFVDVPIPPLVETPRSGALFAAALETRKGCRLALEALRHAPDAVRLAIAGDGPERPRLMRLAERLRIAHRVEFLGAVSRDHLLERLDRCAVALFLGLREEGGLALTEAMLRGAPVVVLGVGGARAIAESSTDPARTVVVEPTSRADVVRTVAAAMTRFCLTPSVRRDATLDQGAARRTLASVLERAVRQAAR